MNRHRASEKIFIEEITKAAEHTKKTSRSLSIGFLIKMIRNQLGMSQKVLSQRAKIPQPTISRLEKEKKNINLSTLYKVLEALSCDLLIIPMLRESIDSLRHKQAKKQAEKHLKYLKGTMNLENQQPDVKLLEELFKQEENRLLQDPKANLWEG